MTETALVLAAGCGRRLGRRGESCPKGFIRLGERTLVEESIERLRSVGVRRVVIVTGHRSDRYDALARMLTGVETVSNPLYASTGSLASLGVGLSAVDGGFLLVESDLTYEARGLRALLDHPAPDALLVSGPTHSGDEVYVEGSGERLIELSKDRSSLGPSVVGEFVGITRVSAVFARRLREVIAALGPLAPRMEYERALVAASRAVPVGLCIVPDLAWSEVDDEGQLLRARTEVYPRVVQSDARER